MGEVSPANNINSEVDETYDENFTEEAAEEKAKKSKEKKGFSKWIGDLLPNSSNKSKAILLSDEEYIKLAYNGFQESLLLVDEPGWKEHKTGSLLGDIVEVKFTEKHGKIFLLTAIVNAAPEYLNVELHQKVEEIVKWNPTILEAHYIRKIDEHTDITYQVTAGGGGGAVKPRDFINLRYNGKIDGRIFSSGISIEYPGYPPTKYIRGENKVGSWCMSPIPRQASDDVERCKFQWLMACDLKGWIPQYIIDVAMPTVMFDFLRYVREFIDNPPKS